MLVQVGRCVATSFHQTFWWRGGERGKQGRGSEGKGSVEFLIKTETSGPGLRTPRAICERKFAAFGSSSRRRPFCRLGEASARASAWGPLTLQLTGGQPGGGARKDFPCAARDFVFGLFSGVAQPQ